MANKDQKIVNNRGSKQAIGPTPVSREDLYFTSEMIIRIKESQQEIKDGESIVVKTNEDLDKFFEGL